MTRLLLTNLTETPQHHLLLYSIYATKLNMASVSRVDCRAQWLNYGVAS